MFIKTQIKAAGFLNAISEMSFYYFGHNGNLKKHVSAVHERKKQFKCGICDASFGLKSSLNRHVATVHEERKMFKCDICNATFGQKGHMNLHIAKVHEGQ